MNRFQVRSTAIYLFQSSLLALAYLGVAEWTLAHVFHISGATVAPVWPASGLAVGVLAACGYRFVLGLAIAGAILIWQGPESLLGVGAICLEGMVGAFLLRSLLRRDRWLARTRDVLGLGLTAGVCSSLSATLGVASFCLSGSLAWNQYGTEWLGYALGDSLGILMVAPVVLTASAWRRQVSQPTLWMDLLGTLAALIVFGAAVFEGWVSTRTAVSLLGGFFPLILWMVFRAGQLGAAVGTLVISILALQGTAHGFGPFAAEDLNHGLYLLWVFLGVMMLTAFLFAAVLGERQEAEQTLARSESTLRAFYDSAPVMMGIFELHDDDIRFVSCNRAVGEFLGRPPEAVANEFLSQLTTRERLELWIEHCRESARTGRASHFELTRPGEQGSRTLSAVVGTVQSGSGGSPRFSFVVQDTTEHRKAEIERDRFFTHSLDMLVIADFQGRIQRANPAFCRAIGYTEEEVQQLAFEALFPTEDFPMAEAALANVAAGSSAVSFEVRLQRKGDDCFWTLWAAAPDPDRQVFYAAGKDISEKKEAEHALLAAKEAADAATNAKSQFLANVTHELRTPLSGIIGMAGLLRSTRLSRQQLEYVEAVKHAADSLLTLVNDVLDFSKIEARKVRMELEPFPLRGLVGRAMKLLAPQAHRKNIELAYRVLPTVPDGLIGDVGRLRQVLMNLVGNAIKFTESGEVMIQVSLDERESDQDPRMAVHFRVSDTGIGIPPSKRDAIFGAFVQADGSTTRKYGGTGLGLAISAQLVELMGGRIWVESEPGQGSTFHFTALLWPEEPGRRGFDEPGPPELVGRRVLVLDDSTVAREFLEAQLRDWRMEPTGVADAREALAALAKACDDGRPFDLMLLDDLPRTDVGTFLKELRKELPETIPCLLMSPAGESGRPPGARRLGVMGELTKPIQPSHLRKAIELLVEGQPLESEEVVTTGAFDRVPRSSALHVLLAEDEPVNRIVVASILEGAGHEVRAVENGRQAVDAFKREPFDVVLMDVQMPELDGIEAAKAIRSAEGGTKRRVPIVALTAHLLDEDKEACLLAGMDEFLSKPVDAADLGNLLDRLGYAAGTDTTHPNVSQASAEPALERDALLRRTEGDVALATELARIFLEDCPKSMEELETSVRAREMDRFQRVLHRLSGSLEAIAARPAATAARRLGEAALGGSSDLESPLGALQDEMQRLTVDLAGLVKESSVT